MTKLEKAQEKLDKARKIMRALVLKELKRRGKKVTKRVKS